VELPMFRWGSDDFAKQEAYRMLFATYHRKTLVNGYSGFSPPTWEAMVAAVQESNFSQLPKQALVVVHEDEYARWGKEAPSFGEELFRSGTDVAYRLNE
jgi:hypothetical protein